MTTFTANLLECAERLPFRRADMTLPASIRAKDLAVLRAVQDYETVLARAFGADGVQQAGMAAWQRLKWSMMEGVDSPADGLAAIETHKRIVSTDETEPNGIRAVIDDGRARGYLGSVATLVSSKIRGLFPRDGSPYTRDQEVRLQELQEEVDAHSRTPRPELTPDTNRVFVAALACTAVLSLDPAVQAEAAALLATDYAGGVAELRAA